ncbi:MAG TPA: hypothetical protein VNA25_19520 [Phycisphaerae bacterium]|nr:hypothetical protein [Phycisphaerae bacterium]
MPEETSAMGPVGQPPRGQQSDMQRILEEDNDTGSSIFVDPPEYGEGERRPTEMPRINLEALGQRAQAATQEAAKQRIAKELHPLWMQSQAIDRELAALEKDDFGDESKKQALLAQRQGIANTVNGPLRIANELFSSESRDQARTIAQMQEQAASEFPEVADEMLDLASRMTIDQQLKPTTYRLLAQQVYGEHVMSGRDRGRISSAGASSGMVGGRSGTQGGGRHEVSFQDVRKLRTMGLKGRALTEAIEGLSR